VQTVRGAGYRLSAQVPPGTPGSDAD